MARTSYQAGLQTLLELLDAFKLQREVAIQRIRARAALSEALEDLALATGEDVDAFLARLKSSTDR
jgi:outer membrane protein TolC